MFPTLLHGGNRATLVSGFPVAKPLFLPNLFTILCRRSISHTSENWGIGYIFKVKISIDYEYSPSSRLWQCALSLMSPSCGSSVEISYQSILCSYQCFKPCCTKSWLGQTLKLCNPFDHMNRKLSLCTKKKKKN